MHYKQLFEKICKNSKLLWNVVNNLVKKLNDKTGVTELFVDGIVHTDQTEICDKFNEHFASAGKRVQEKIKAPQRNEPLKTVKRVSKNLSFKKITELQICKVVANMPANSSSGFDGISNILLKNIISVIKLPLCVIFNKSLKEGIIPDLMKIAKVLPLHKGGERDLPDNYRPISLLLVISKVLEKFVYKFVVLHLDDQGVLYHRQYGFRKHHSTTDAVLNFSGEVLTAFGNDMMTLAVFIDLKKAFDSVSHRLILDKLRVPGCKRSGVGMVF